MVARAERGEGTSCDLITALLGAWLVAGGALDAWAHQRTALDSFLTPWHAILYSGFAATATWVAWIATRQRSATYGLGLVGICIFGAGAIGDLIWHSVFGVERNLAAAVSPTHLLLFIGAALILSAPLRAAWRQATTPAGAQLGAVSISVMSLMLLASLILYFASPFVFRDIGTPVEPRMIDGGFIGVSITPARAGISSILISTIALFTPLVLMRMRWRIPFGIFAAILGVVVTVSSATAGTAQTHDIVSVWIAAIAIDGASFLLPRSRRGNLVFGSVAPAILWGSYTTARALDSGVAWEPELWAGSIVLASIIGASIVVVATALGTAADPSPAQPHV